MNIDYVCVKCVDMVAKQIDFLKKLYKLYKEKLDTRIKNNVDFIKNE